MNDNGDPWVSEVPDSPVEGVYRFTVPAGAAAEATGVEDGQVIVQGRFGPGGAWTELNADGDGERVATIGPLRPGRYRYRYAVRPAPDAEAVAFRDPEAKGLSALSVPGPDPVDYGDEERLPVATAIAAPGAPTPWVGPDGTVTFEAGSEFAASSRVALWGNFGPAGSWPRTPMARQDDGSWRLSLPLEGGSYYYKFEVDGVDYKDERNPAAVRSEPTWSTFTVPGDTLLGRFTAPAPAAGRGEVGVMEYASTAGEAERSAYVWTPPGYDADRAEPYPVLYLQHGGGQTWADWIEVGRADRILDRHLREGAIAPMVVVMADGNDVDFPAEITARIVPTAEKRYNVSADPRRRALAGLSMGSGQTLATLWAHPGEFAYIGAMSAFGDPPEGTDVAAVNAGTALLRVYSGDRQDFTYEPTLDLIAAMERSGVEHEFAPIIPGPHCWDVWQRSLIDLLPRLFRA
ncbi:alpha/beta hydrolase-fold protein [Glycomyces mayteni]|uniref:Alpha/beta hydrolase-fold protein n=1 Tax=Glycomyces mayteni TaxID=543887 RepID=A0ABW2D0Q6_9ACTN|nr:hypothetical protein GCM10025732_45280 [Glycomyces mayteni]